MMRVKPKHNEENRAWLFCWIAEKMLRTIAFSALLVLTTILATRSNAEQPPAGSCAIRLQTFVELIDGLLGRNVVADEPYQTVIRQYLPATGCTVEEVISISKTSRFFSAPYEQHAFYTISFKNADINVTFGLKKATGNIDYPNVLSTHAPSW
jgi:hypothetical protein